MSIGIQFLVAVEFVEPIVPNLPIGQHRTTCRLLLEPLRPINRPEFTVGIPRINGRLADSLKIRWPRSSSKTKSSNGSAKHDHKSAGA